MGCVFSIASSVRECVSEEMAYAMLSRAMQQTKIQPKSQKCLWRGKPRWQLSSEGVCRAHWAQVLPIVLISRHLQYTGATQADWNAGGVSGLSCDVICVSFFFVFPAPFAGARQFRNSISLKPERMMRCQHIVMKIVPSFRKIDIYGHVKNKKKELHSPVKNKVPRVNEQTGWPPLAQITLSNCFLYDILSLMSLWGNFSPLFFKVLLQFIEVWGHLFMHKCLTSQTWVWLRSGLWLRHL